MDFTLNGNSEDYNFAIAAGLYLVANELADLEKWKKRKERKQRVAGLKFEELKKSWPEHSAGINTAGDIRNRLKSMWSGEDALNYVIDLVFLSPFSPYELIFSMRDFNNAMETVAGYVGVQPLAFRSILNSRDLARKAYSDFTWLRKLAVNLFRGLLIGVAWVLMGPWLGVTLISSHAGIAGLTFANQGLAHLGFRAMDPLIVGHAGSRMIFSGVGSLSRQVIGGSSNLDKLSSQAARYELIKLQVNFREVLLPKGPLSDEVTETIDELKGELEEVKRKLDVERELNEKISTRVKELEYTSRSFMNAIRWMEKQRDRYRREFE